VARSGNACACAAYHHVVMCQRMHCKVHVQKLEDESVYRVELPVQTTISISSKRDWDVSEIEEGKDVCVHGIPLLVSPVQESKTKKGVHYFDARLSNGKKMRLVVSFDAGLQAPMKKAEEEELVVALVNSIVRKAARFVVTDECDCKTTLSAFEPVLSRIVDSASGSSLAHKVMTASGKVFCYNDRNVVFSAQDI